MEQPNSQTVVEVTRDELPLHCPTPDSSLWNSHPRVYIALDDTPEASCPYCGTTFRLVEKKAAAANS
ncbi:MAG: zinc-finger domain-containing protein [Granulosicoccus sp.]|nr:zinc-finger domain-containing protein [Granulosicoccus sp.]